MPTLSARFQAQSQVSNGNTIQVSPTARQQFGPVIQITLAPLEIETKATVDLGKTLQQPVVGRALIDTGASTTCVDEAAARQAGCAVVGTGPITSATHDNHIVPIFAAKIDIAGIGQYIEALRAYGSNLASQQLIALIGRDVLSSCVFIYNGSDGSFSLSV